MSDLTQTEFLNHTELMAKRDGAVRMWIVMPGSSAKLVRDGVSFARIDTLTDGTIRTTLHGHRGQLSSWDVACNWLFIQLSAAVLS